MRNPFKSMTTFRGILRFAAFCVAAGSISAMPPIKKGDEPMESATAVKKKRAGEECKSADECRRHHRCEQAGDKKVCVAPEPHEIPKT